MSEDYPDFFIAQNGFENAESEFNRKIKWYTDRNIPFDVKFHYADGRNYWTGLIYPAIDKNADAK